MVTDSKVSVLKSTIVRKMAVVIFTYYTRSSQKVLFKLHWIHVGDRVV